MTLLPGWLQDGYRRAIEPVADWLVRRRINPNTITTVGTACSVAGGIIYATGHIRTGGWVLGLTALFDVLDGTVARRTNRSTVFGAFYDSTLDRVADGAVLAGLAFFYATSVRYGSPIMVVVCLAGILGSFLTSYIRARAEGLGIDAKVGMMQRPERVVLLTAPQAFFGLALDGLVLAGIVVLLTATSWVTVVQRMQAVHRATRDSDRDAAPRGDAPARRGTAHDTPPEGDAPQPILAGSPDSLLKGD